MIFDRTSLQVLQKRVTIFLCSDTGCGQCIAQLLPNGWYLRHLNDGKASVIFQLLPQNVCSSLLIRWDYHPSGHLKSLCPQHSACSSMISPDICISLGRRAPPSEFSTPKAPSQCDGGPSLYHFSFLIVSSEYHCEPRSIVMAVQPLIILLEV